MKGARPLNNTEIRAVRGAFTGKFEHRNRGLFMLGVSIGGRISELLSLTIGDVWQNNAPVQDVLFDKTIVKGGEVARAVPVNNDGIHAIVELISWHLDAYKGDNRLGELKTLPSGNSYRYELNASIPLFPSQKRDRFGNVVAINRVQADHALKKAFVAAGLNGKLATHSMRKSFAQRLYHQTHDMYAVQEMLGHKNITTTQKYVGVDYANVKQALEAMSLHAEDAGLTNQPRLNEASNAELVEELLKRGYDFKQFT